MESIDPVVAECACLGCEFGSHSVMPGQKYMMTMQTITMIM